ncbi:MAG: protein kinase [Deltaproteobacteria bacterium]|nr:protein kinase [Deltaproteobacteria bacterium]
MRVCPQCRSVFRADLARCAIDGSVLFEQDEDPLVGSVLDGRYEILENLGSGAMATVYRARHTALEFEYAVKVLAGDYAAQGETAKRFRREALWMSRIQHPNVVSVKDFGTTPGGLTFLAMEYVRGSTLREAMDAEGQVDPVATCRIMRQLASGLQEAHRLSYVHRDMKPSNVMVTNGIAKIFDFGLVGLENAHESDVSREGYVMGTPTYMAPEQASNGEIGPSADLYSLGVMSFEMLTGYVPYRGRSITETLVMHIMDPVPAVPIDHPIAELVASLLAKKPEHRPKDTQAVVERIDHLLTQAETASRASASHRRTTLGSAGAEQMPSAFSLTADLLPPPKGADAKSSASIISPRTTDPNERKRLGSILIEAAYISDLQLEQALTTAAREHKRLGRVLVDEGFLTEEHLVRALARHTALDECNPELPIHARVLGMLPQNVAEQHCILPVAVERSKTGRTLIVATFDPFDEAAERAVQKVLEPDMEVRWTLSTERAIRAGIARHYGQAPDSASASTRSGSRSGSASTSDRPARGTTTDPSLNKAGEQPKSQVLAWMRSARARTS